MKVYRLTEVEVPDDLKGICWNESMRGKIVWKKANSKMCSVGIIRRGRSWGDYDGLLEMLIAEAQPKKETSEG